MNIPSFVDVLVKGFNIRIYTENWNEQFVAHCIRATLHRRLSDALRRSRACMDATADALNQGQWFAQTTPVQKADHVLSRLTHEERAALLAKYL
jgi:hypothetical protein